MDSTTPHSTSQTMTSYRLRSYPTPYCAPPFTLASREFGDCAAAPLTCSQQAHVPAAPQPDHAGLMDVQVTCMQLTMRAATTGMARSLDGCCADASARVRVRWYGTLQLHPVTPRTAALSGGSRPAQEVPHDLHGTLYVLYLCQPQGCNTQGFVCELKRVQVHARWGVHRWAPRCHAGMQQLGRKC
jgi:hypothetical protein